MCYYNGYMIYKDLKRINTIDSEIMLLHQQLQSLYDERLALFKNSVTNTKLVSMAAKPKTPQTSTQQIYETMQANWKRLGVKVPSYATLKPKLEATYALVERLSAAGEATAHMTYLAVPPTTVLLKAMLHAGAPRVDVTSFKDIRVPTSKTWQCSVVYDGGNAAQKVNDLQRFVNEIHASEAEENKLDMDAHTLAAAYLMGSVKLKNSSWTLLLADATSINEIPCAQLVGGALHFMIDDSAGLLGSNYCYRSITVKI